MKMTQEEQQAILKLLEKATDAIQWDEENQVAVCKLCNMELEESDKGHKDSCLVTDVCNLAKLLI